MQVWSVMILSNNLIQKTHYEIIGIKEDASLEEIRKAYRSSILNYHPDKLQTSSQNPYPQHEFGNRFLDVQRAWEILADPRYRALYDNELRALRQDAVTAEDVELQDLTIEDDESCFELSYNCRCGDYFSVDSSELAEMGYLFSRTGSKITIRTPGSLAASVVLPCGSCSLKIRLLIDGDITLETELNRWLSCSYIHSIRTASSFNHMGKLVQFGIRFGLHFIPAGCMYWWYVNIDEGNFVELSRYDWLHVRTCDHFVFQFIHGYLIPELRKVI